MPQKINANKSKKKKKKEKRKDSLGQTKSQVWEFLKHPNEMAS